MDRQSDGQHGWLGEHATIPSADGGAKLGAGEEAFHRVAPERAAWRIRRALANAVGQRIGVVIREHVADELRSALGSMDSRDRRVVDIEVDRVACEVRDRLSAQLCDPGADAEPRSDAFDRRSIARGGARGRAVRDFDRIAEIVRDTLADPMRQRLAKTVQRSIADVLRDVLEEQAGTLTLPFDMDRLTARVRERIVDRIREKTGDAVREEVGDALRSVLWLMRPIQDRIGGTQPCASLSTDALRAAGMDPGRLAAAVRDRGSK